jgi:hypothetical protein
MRYAFAFTVVLAARTAIAAPPSPILTADTPVSAPVASTALGDQSFAAVAYGGGHWLGVWNEVSSPGYVIRGARFDADGTVLESPAKVIATLQRNSRPAVAFDGTNYVVTWAEGTSSQLIFITSIDPTTGAIANPTQLTATAAVRSDPVIAAGGNTALVCWTDISSSTTRCTHIAGGVVSSTVTNTQVSAASKTAVVPSVTWGGATANNYLVLYEDLSGIGIPDMLGAFVDGSGVTAIAGKINTGSGRVSDPNAASDGSTYVAYWADWTSPNAQIHERSIAFNGTLGTEATIAQDATYDFHAPQPVFANGTFFIAWEAIDYSTSPATYQGIYGARCNAAGTTCDTGASISVMAHQSQALFPADNDQLGSGSSIPHAIASDGAGHVMAVWWGTLAPYRNISVSGLDVFALPTDLTGTQPTTPTTLPAVASTALSQQPSYQRHNAAATNGTTTLVVWEDQRNVVSTGVDIYGMRFQLDGTPIDAAPFVICNQTADQFEPSVAAIPGGDFLVAWADGRGIIEYPPGSGFVSVYAARVGANGTVKDPGGTALTLDTKYAKVTPSVAASGSGWLVAWEDWRNSNTTPSPEVWAVTVAANGSVGAEVTVTTNACAPAVVHDGTRYLVAYETPCSRRSGAPAQSDISAHWVSTAGAVESTTVAIASQTDSETAPAVASDGKRAYVVWRAKNGGGTESILGAPIADDAAALAQTPTTLVSGVTRHTAPSISVAVPAANAPVGLVTWIGSATEGLQGVRVTSSFAVAPEGVFTLAAGVMYDTAAGQPAQPGFLLSGDGLSYDGLYTPPAGLASASTGETLVAFNPMVLLSGVQVARVHTRKLGIVGLGGVCSTMTGGQQACTLGFCTGGQCCDTACDGICQACGVNGCVEAPQTDLRCPALSVSCVSLTTECRVFTDPPANRCAGFGECSSSTALSECTAFTDAPDGTACTSACGGMGMCVAGGCACMSVAPAPYVRTLPPASGCSVTGRGDSGAPVLVLLLALALAFRRKVRFALLLLLGVAGCNSAVSVDFTLHLDDPVLVATDHARIVVSSADGTAFPAMAAETVKPGLTVTNEDADGDGKIDIVLTLGKDYAFLRDNRFRLVNPSVGMPLNLKLRAETFDNLGNRFAQIGGASTDPAATSVPALLTPGQETQAAQLKPQCLNAQCSDATLRLTPADATFTATLAEAPTALAVGSTEALVGAAHADSTQGGLARPNGGLAWLYQGGATPSTTPNLTIAGVAGNELGAAVAIADLDVDGAAELILGAPGVNSGAGAVFIIWGGATTGATVDLGASMTLPAFVSVVTGTATNDRLGVSLTVTDVNGDGKPDVIAGADGAATAYAITSASLTKGASTAAAQLPAATGPSSSRFGASVAAGSGRVIIGAPTQSSMGAVYTLAPTDLAMPARAATAVSPGKGGGFGAAVTALDIDGSGNTLAVAAAPDDGPGTTSVLATSPMIVQGTTPMTRLGSSLARLSWPGGDAVVLGAPSTVPTSSPGAGSVLIVRSFTLGVAPQLVVGADGRPAAVSIDGAHAGDGLGLQVAVGDLDGDGYADVLVTSASKSLLVFRGPLL